MEISLAPVFGQENLGRAAGLLDPNGVLAGHYDPAHLDLWVGLGETHDRATGADFYIITMRAQAKQTLHASHIQNR